MTNCDLIVIVIIVKHLTIHLINVLLLITFKLIKKFSLIFNEHFF